MGARWYARRGARSTIALPHAPTPAADDAAATINLAVAALSAPASAVQEAFAEAARQSAAYLQHTGHDMKGLPAWEFSWERSLPATAPDLSPGTDAAPADLAPLAPLLPDPAIEELRREHRGFIRTSYSALSARAGRELAADDQHALGDALEQQRARGVDDALVLGHEGQLHRLAAGGDDRLGELDHLLAAVGSDHFEVVRI